MDRFEGMQADIFGWEQHLRMYPAGGHQLQYVCEVKPGTSWRSPPAPSCPACVNCRTAAPQERAAWRNAGTSNGNG